MPTPPENSNTDGNLSAEAVALMLLDGLEESAGHIDILMLIVREIPDWESRYEYFRADPHRIEYSRDRSAPVRKAFEAILRGEEAGPLLEQALRTFDRKPN